MAGFGAAVGGFAGGIVGGGVVRLFLDASQYNSALVKADVQGKTATGSMGAGMTKFAGIATAAWGAVGIAALKFGADAIHAAEGHEVALSQLSIAAGSQTEAFTKLAAAQVDLTGFTEDSIIAAETQLARLHLTDQQMKTLLTSTEDYARATGTDLPTAAGKVEKAFLGNTKAVKELGINYKATGSFEHDFIAMTSAMASQVGGQAAAYLQTTAGQIEHLRAEYDKATISIGTQLLPAVRELNSALASELQVVQGHVTQGADALTFSLHAMTLALGGQILSLRGDKTATQALDQAQQRLSTSLAQQKKMTDAATAAAQAQKNANDALLPGIVGLIAQRRILQADIKAEAGLTGGPLRDAQLKAIQDKISLTAQEKAYQQTLGKGTQSQKQVVGDLVAVGHQIGIHRREVLALTGDYANLWATINAGPMSTGNLGGAMKAHLQQILRAEGLI